MAASVATGCQSSTRTGSLTLLARQLALDPLDVPVDAVDLLVAEGSARGHLGLSILSLDGPVKTWNLPAAIWAFLSAISFFTGSGRAALTLTRSFMPSLMPPQTVVLIGVPARAASATFV